MFTIDLSIYRVVDLSYEVIPPGTEDRPFQVERGLLADNAYKYDVLKTHSHVGTHVEALAHFFDGGKDATQYPLSAFFGRGILLEIDDAQATHAVLPAFLEEAIGDLIQPGDIVICRNNDEDSKQGGSEKLPYLTPEAAEWLKAHRIKMLGIDNYVRLAKDIPEGRKLHDILMRQDVMLIEWLDHLEDLRKREFFVMALPFKVKGMDSGWTRVIAIEDRE